MKLAMMAVPPSDINLQLLKQIGIDHAVHYDMEDLPDDLDGIKHIRNIYLDHDIEWKIAEAGPAIDRIVFGKDGADAQIERYKRIIGHLGKVGVEVIAYNFMPQISKMAMVIRTDYDYRTRGGARTSAFKLNDVRNSIMPHSEVMIPVERIWENLEKFLREVLPAAESAGIRLAMHPDDPPMASMCGLNRIMSSVADFDRLMAISPSPSNAITLCLGCFAEMKVDLIDLIERFAGKFPFVHVRNIKGTPTDFFETFPDDGDTDLAAIIGKLVEIGYDGYLRSDHAPELVTEVNSAGPKGYGLQGHIFAVGYIRGLIQMAQLKK
jgi:mannonate dehydratase